MERITVEELERIYTENTTDEAAKLLGVSTPTLMRYIDGAGIPRKGKGGGMAAARKVIVSDER